MKTVAREVSLLNSLISVANLARERVGVPVHHLAAREPSTLEYSVARERLCTSDHVGLAPFVYIRLAEALEHLFPAPLGGADVDDQHLVLLCMDHLRELGLHLGQGQSGEIASNHRELEVL